MMKSELIDILAREQNHLAYKDVELAVRCILEQMSAALASGERIEIRGFGSFSLHFRPPRVGRNPKTGDAVALSGKHVPHFKPGKELRDRVNQAYQAELARLAQQQDGGSDEEEGDEEGPAERSRAAASLG
ncbi:integration host factor subunit beta [Halochromatium glycolicum]|jgi:integration host factor subunit beta|uniref:Integration host factor subunit beta n=1 Tax=Halochromatium glycolicum TaxID=85075 RepID=A0AAJ0XAC8_9GAMM|nr:integration host factor subunit beta [Halochromatium glycolicum]MBK1704677.1 integration host factor subunit beta [Halochromatium glycolicum]NBC48354.1 integration host factor subunit beta [Gammaproteobacteria bacterium]